LDADDVTSHLDTLVRAHRVATLHYRGHVVVGNSGLALQAVGYDRGPGHFARVQLDVIARSTILDGRAVVESFAGVGDSFEKAVLDAFDKFSRASLHVLVAAFVNRDLGQDQVQWERWSNGVHSWDVCLGLLLLYSKDIQPPAYGELLDQLKELFLLEATPSAHWIRTFRGAAGTTVLRSEALFDNDDWPTGRRLVDSWQWPVTEQYQTVRHFLLALPSS
jgi:hypothetical protein